MSRPRAADRAARAAAALLLLLAAGCIQIKSSFGTPIPEGRVADIVDGETTRGEVRRWFGPPSTLARPSLLDLVFERDGEDVAGLLGPVTEDVYTWVFIESRTTVAFFPLLFLDANFVSRSVTLSVFFDEDGRVRYHAFRVDDT